MKKISEFFKNWRDRAREKRMKQIQCELANDAKARFNIITYNDIPVITYNGVVITAPDSQLSGDELIRQLMELRKIYAEK